MAGSVYEYGAPCKTCGEHVLVLIVGPVTITEKVANDIVGRYLETRPPSFCVNPKCSAQENRFTPKEVNRPHRTWQYSAGS